MKRVEFPEAERNKVWIFTVWVGFNTHKKEQESRLLFAASIRKS